MGPSTAEEGILGAPSTDEAVGDAMGGMLCMGMPPAFCPSCTLPQTKLLLGKDVRTD